MPDLAELNLVINSGQVTEAQARLQALAAAAAKAEAGAAGVTKASQEQQQAMAGVAGTAQHLYGFYLQLAAGAGILGTAYEAIKMGAHFEETVAQFTAITGSTQKATEAIAQLQEFAKKTPFAFQGLIEVDKKLLAVGFDAKTAQGILQASADTAAAKGGGEQMVASIAGAFDKLEARGKVTSRTFMMLTMQQIPAWKYLADYIGTTEAVAQERVNKGLISGTTAVKALQQGMEDSFGGQALSAAQRFDGIVKNIKEDFSQTLAQIGVGLLKAFDVEGKLKAFLVFMDSAKRVVLDAVDILRGLPPRFADSASAAEKLVEVAKIVAGVLELIVAAKVLTGFTNLAVNVALFTKSLFAAVTASSPLLVVTLALIAAFAAFEVGSAAYASNWGDIQTIGTKAIYAVEDAWSVWVRVFTETTNTIRGMWGLVVREITEGSNKIKEVTNSMGNLFGHNLNLQPTSTAGIFGPDAATEANKKVEEDYKRDQARIQDELNKNLAWNVSGAFTTRGQGGGGAKNPIEQARADLALMGDSLAGVMGKVLGVHSAWKDANKVLEDGTRITKEGTLAIKGRISVVDEEIANLQKKDALLGKSKLQQEIASQNEKFLPKLEEEASQLKIPEGEQTKTYLNDNLAKLDAYIILREKAKATAGIDKELDDLKEKSQLYGLTDAALERETQIRQILNKAKEEGVTLDAAEINKVTAAIDANMQYKASWEQVHEVSKSSADAIGQGFTDAVTGAKTFQAAMLDVLKSIEQAFIKTFVTTPIQNNLEGLFSKNLGSLFGLAPATTTAAVPAAAMASGGIFDSPTLWNSGDRSGIAGEAGPEGVLPLARGPGGKLGVMNHGGGGGNVTHNWYISTPDANSFRASQSQITQRANRALR